MFHFYARHSFPRDEQDLASQQASLWLAEEGERAASMLSVGQRWGLAGLSISGLMFLWSAGLAIVPAGQTHGLAAGQGLEESAGLGWAGLGLAGRVRPRSTTSGMSGWGAAPRRESSRRTPSPTMSVRGPRRPSSSRQPFVPFSPPTYFCCGAIYPGVMLSCSKRTSVNFESFHLEYTEYSKLKSNLNSNINGSKSGI